MKCPKCDYLGFESTDRCRNCGYEFSLSSSPVPDVDLPLELRPVLDLDRIIGAPAPDLPLFGGTPGDDGQPLITTPARPRAPLGVRRATPEIPRARVRTPRPPEDMLFGTVPAARRAHDGDAYSSFVSEVSGGGGPAEIAAAPARRAVAALVDGALLLGLDAAVLYFTLRLCNLTASQTLELPAIPLLAFFLLLNGGYLVAFTAVGGQSIGKMALGIKVVSDEDLPVPFGRATLRTLAYFASALPLGAGFLPGVLGADRLALHDRLAHTRVVRPSV
jgi:uncharacterized RDD family membrane protein YckC